MDSGTTYYDCDPSDQFDIPLENGAGQFHLLVKGFKCGRTTNREMVKRMVTGFLDNLSGFDQHCPVQYRFHHPNLDAKVLKVTLSPKFPKIFILILARVAL